MPIKPGKDETQSEWMSRCVPEMLEAGSDRSQEQAVAICLDIWRNRNKQLEPDPGESRDEFMDRCTSELTDGGMEVVQMPPAMMAEFRASTAPLFDAFLKRVPASEKPVRAFLAEVKRT